jgi:hypothetical protein
VSDVERKGRRSGGFFLFLLGAGLLLESSVVWYGAVLMGIGALWFVWGVGPGQRDPGDLS